jgi:succinyl-diaminopimelate desuccinylase
VVDPDPLQANIVGTVEGGAGAGRHLVLNGHIDAFPADEKDPRWKYGAWSGKIAEGKVWGRGSCDMKCGTTASIMTYRYLARMKDKWKGKLTLTCVSDEETFGPMGARYLMDNVPEVLGDCCLNGEPSSPHSIRFGEKGPFWTAFVITTKGGHGAYPHSSPNAAKIASRLVADLEKLEEIKAVLPDNVARALEAAKDTIDRAMGDGASRSVAKVTVNIGVIQAGLKVNMIADQARVEADIRLPVGVTKEMVMTEINKILAKYPEAKMEEINFMPPSWCEPYHEMVEHLQANAALGGFKPVPVVSLGGTDARLWRYKNIPAYVYGPSPEGMGACHESVEIETFLHVVRTHALSAYDYLSRA